MVHWRHSGGYNLTRSGSIRLHSGADDDTPREEVCCTLGTGKDCAEGAVSTMPSSKLLFSRVSDGGSVDGEAVDVTHVLEQLSIWDDSPPAGLIFSTFGGVRERHLPQCVLIDPRLLEVKLEQARQHQVTNVQWPSA